MSKKTIIGLTLMALLVLPVSGCGEAAAEDQGVIAAASDKLNDAGTYRSDMDMQLYLDISGPDIEAEFADVIPLELSMQASADMDVSDYDRQKVRMYDMTYDGTREILMLMMEQEGEPPATGHILDGMIRQMLKDVEVLVYEDDIYFYFGDQWYEISYEEMADMPDSGMDARELECVMDAAAGSAGYGESMQLMDDMLVDVRDRGSEEIDGVDTTRYEASVDMEAAMLFYEDYMESYTAELERCGVAGAESDDEFEEVMDVIASMAGELEETILVETWIDAEGYLRRQRVTVELDYETISRLLEAVDDETLDGFEEDITALDMRLEVTTTNSDIGADLDIERPGDAIPFMELLEDLEGSFGGGVGVDSFPG